MKATNYCIYYCTCIIKIELGEEREEELRGKLLELEKEIKSKVDFAWHLRHDKKLFDIRIFGDEQKNMVTFKNDLKLANIMMDPIEIPKKGEYLVHNCARVAFNKSKFKVVGGPSIPQEISLTKDLTDKLGAAKLRGFILEFAKSPLGLNVIEVDSAKDEIGLELQTMTRVKSLNDILIKTFEHIEHIGKLFIGEK